MAKELYDILKNFHGFTKDMLYDELVTFLHATQFNEVEYKKFIIAYSIFITGKLSYEEFQRVFSNLDKLSPTKVDSLVQKVKVGFPDWIGISKVEDTSANILKIYLSVDNGDLHLFATEFLKTCLEQKMEDYDFKINNDESLSRRDNVVIYCNEKNFGTYLQMVELTLEKLPDIHFNSSHLLAAPYDERICCGMDYDGGKISYTDKLCEMIFEAYRKNKPIDEIVNTIEMFKLKQAANFRTLAEKTKKSTLTQP